MCAMMITMLMINDNVLCIYTSKSFSISPGTQSNVIDLESSGFGFLNGGTMKVNITTKSVRYHTPWKLLITL